MPASRRYFPITTNMLDAGVAAMDNCRQIGGHTPRTACQAIFHAMLDAAYDHPGSPRSRVLRTIPKGHSSILLAGKYLPRRIIHPDDFGPTNVKESVSADGSTFTRLRHHYWYLLPRYDRELRKILADPKKVAELEFFPPDY